MFKKPSEKIAHLLNSILIRKKTLQELKDSTSIPEQAFLNAFLLAQENYDATEIFKFSRNYRHQLAGNQQEIDLAPVLVNQKRQIKDIYKRAASSQQWGEFYYFLSRSFKPSNILEIGSNLGVSGQYFLQAIADNPKASFTSLEGIPDLCKIAKSGLDSLPDVQAKYRIIEGLYDKTIPDLLKQSQQYDLVFIDGNHHYKPTIDYYEQLRPYLARQAIIIFDDINWNEEMKEAWRFLSLNPQCCAIDLYKLGILIIDKDHIPFNKSYKMFLSW